MQVTRDRAAALFIAGALLALVSGCDQVGSGSTVEYTGPDPTALAVDYDKTCPSGTASTAATLEVFGEGFAPGEDVGLTWDDAAFDQHGQWPSTTADRRGEIDVTLPAPTDYVTAGSTLDIWAQGPGSEGLVARHGMVSFGSC